MLIELSIPVLLLLARQLAQMLVLLIERSIPAHAVRVEVNRRLIVVFGFAHVHLHKLVLLSSTVFHGLRSLLPRAAPSIGGLSIDVFEDPPRSLELV